MKALIFYCSWIVLLSNFHERVNYVDFLNYLNKKINVNFKWLKQENDHRRSILWPKWAEDLENGAADSQEDSGVTSISLGSEEEFCVKRPRMMEESVCENQAQARSNDAVEEKEKVAIWSLLNLDSPPM